MSDVLTGQALQTVPDLADAQQVSVVEVLRRALGHERWLAEETAAGSRIFAENRRARERRQLVLD